MKYGDLFSGIGCVAQALQSLGIPFDYEFACDNDKACKANLLHNFSVSQFYDEVRTITSLPKVDLFTAGFPCQPFSSANRTEKKGLAHKSGDLFDETFRCLKLCDPEVFILENVAALTHRPHQEYFNHILNCLSTLTDYQICYKVLNSRDHGTPQSRPRIYIIGRKHGTPKYPDTKPLDFTLRDVIDLSVPLLVDTSKSKTIDVVKSKIKPGIMYTDNGQSTGAFTRLYEIDKTDFSYCITAGARNRLYYIDSQGTLHSRKYTIDEIRKLQRINPSFVNICTESQFAKQIGNGMDVQMMAQLIKINL
jgi:DNA (cytosine-5)-methyltransferase 1